MDTPELSPALVLVNTQRADAKRREAAELRRQAAQLEATAAIIERTWGIPAPCHCCGAREGCSH